MIEEAYCSFEVSKLLKEKGFNEPCRAVYEEKILRINTLCDYFNSELSSYVCAPTHQMAMSWLREEKNIVIVIEPNVYDYVNEKNKSYSCSLWIGDNYYEYIESKDYPSYNEAAEAALKYCLENLI